MALRIKVHLGQIGCGVTGDDRTGLVFWCTKGVLSQQACIFSVYGAEFPSLTALAPDMVPLPGL